MLAFCRKKKPAGAVSMFGGVNLFGGPEQTDQGAAETAKATPTQPKATESGQSGDGGLFDDGDNEDIFSVGKKSKSVLQYFSFPAQSLSFWFQIWG